MVEPPRIDSLDVLQPYVRERIIRLCAAMRKRGFDPRIYETYRTRERQAYLYGKGRSRLKCRIARIDPKWSQPKSPVVTKTMQSKHMTGKASDLISRKNLWWHNAFFKALKEEAQKVGLHTLGFEESHCEWRG